jgi:hypothetical protein
MASRSTQNRKKDRRKQATAKQPAKPDGGEARNDKRHGKKAKAESKKPPAAAKPKGAPQGAGQQAGRQERVGLHLRDGELQVVAECLCRCAPRGVSQGDAALVSRKNKDQLPEKRAM